MYKKLILHDLPPEKLLRLLPDGAEGYTVFPACPAVQLCFGCFGCWLKTPGECVIDDRCKGLASMISRHEEFVVITRIVFGGLSPDVKAVIDRCIGYVMPFFRIVEGEMHHTLRYEHKFSLRYVFYGHEADISEEKTARKLVAANALNLGAENYFINFYQSPDAIEAV